MGRLTRLLRWFNLLLVLATFLAYLAPLVSPAQFWPLSFFGLLYPWLLLGNFLCILGWLALRKYYFIFSAGCLLMGWGHVQSYIGLHFAQAAPADSTIHLMTFNCYDFRYHDKNREWVSESSLPEAFPLGDWDIICFQEFPTRGRNQYVGKYIKEKSSMKSAIYQTGGGLALFSRYPIEAHDTHYFPNRSNGYQYADLKINGNTIRLFNIHLQSSSVSKIADQVAEDGSLEEKKTWLSIRKIMGRYMRTTIMRANQAEEIAEKIKESPYPVLLCGDFNEIPQSYAYHTLSRGLQDAFKARGRGLGITYGGKIPALRIDYVMAGPQFEVLSHRIGRSSFSDHYPVYSTVRLRE